MKFEEYRRYDAIGLAELVRKRRISAEEVLNAAIDRAEQVNPLINAIVHKQYEQGRKALSAAPAEAPLRGVPYLIKDLGLGTFQNGEPATICSALFKDFVADHDSAYVKRCKQAGLVIIGRSSTPEFGINPSTEPRLYGPCRNPWNLEFSTGGSSGGAAAAVSAGILPVAHATDGGGSIRMPAAHCGLFGLKPSRGRVSMAPDAGEGWGGLSTIHVISRSVSDSALILDCTAGSEPGDPYTVPVPQGSFLSATKRRAPKLKIALMLKDHRDAKLDPDCHKAVENAAKLCADLGHVIEEDSPKIDLAELYPMNRRISAANIARVCNARWKALGREPSPNDLEPVTWAAYQRALGITAVDYVEAIAVAHAAGRKLADFFAKYDVILSATCGPPKKVGYFDMSGDVKLHADRTIEYMGVTPLHNAAGTPAMAVPLHWTDCGLPIGVHFAGRYGEEATLLTLATQLETAQPWFDRVPAI
ncbi:amidase [Bradyrhizobium sp. 138]|uniref:amidase n=1 Tax=Bradyrhizobium sp. 138 TaxID=2782615 RepID=UPI001FF7B609|nr:amidase [Bradyrhizobium sp. 138]MCK1738283.1 amidase [Bradyrhizobium sp. 138]